MQTSLATEVGSQGGLKQSRGMFGNFVSEGGRQCMHLELCWAPHKPERHVCRVANSPHFQIGGCGLCQAST